MNECVELIKKEKLVLISRGIPFAILVRALEAAAEGGIVLFESTFDHRLEDPVTENAEKISALKKALGSRIRFGAGTVLTREEVRAARDAGAEYIISPDTDPDVIDETKRLGLTSIPGAMTPSEIKRAWSLGADLVKLFPADDLGLHYIQNLKGPLGHIPLMATGGVNTVTIPQYLHAGMAAVGTGVTIFRPDLIAAEDYEGIRTLAKMHVDTVRMA